MMEPTSGSITNHMFVWGWLFSSKHYLSQGLGMIDVGAWNRLSSPTCQVRWNRFTCVERNSKLMPLRTRRVSPGKRLAANEKSHLEELADCHPCPLELQPDSKAPPGRTAGVSDDSTLGVWANISIARCLPILCGISKSVEALHQCRCWEVPGNSKSCSHWKSTKLRCYCRTLTSLTTQGLKDQLLQEVLRIFNIRFAADSIRYHWLTSIKGTVCPILPQNYCISFCLFELGLC